MKVPKISVILPCYNVAPYIGKCLDSLLAQTLTDIEIICVDDKSTDGTADVIASYALRDSRIKAFGFDKNQGVAAARNYGQKRAKAKYIAFVDPDDWVDADFYEKLYDALLNSDADFVVSNIREISIDNKCFEHTDWLQSVSQNKLNFNYTLWCALYRKSFLVDNKIDNPVGVITSQDTVFITKCAVLANRIITVPNAYYNYIRREKSLSSAFLSDVKIDSKITAAKLILDFLNSTAISPTDYHHVYSIMFKHIVFDYFTRTTKYKTRLKLMSAALELFNHMKHKELFLSSMPDVAPYLICSDTAGLYDYNLKLFRSNYPEKTAIFYKQRCPNGWRHIYFCGIKILSYQKRRTVRIPALKKCKYVHIMHNDKFIAPFVDFMNRHFNMDEHLFLCMHTCPQFPFPTGKNVVKIRDLRGIKLNRANIKQVICHSLFIPGLVDYLYQHQDILTHKAYWCIWGGDLYNAPRDAVNDFVRKNFYAYIGLMDREYALNKYGMRDNFYGANYIFPTLFGNDDIVIQKSEHPIRIQVNNSADDSTLEMLDILSKFRDQDIEIYTILSYGKMEYRDQIIARGTELFGDKFNYLGDYLAPDEYKEFVKKNHILILNQNRQQGVGNTILNIQYGNKVFIRGDVSTYKYLNDVDGVKIFDSRKIGDMTFDEFIRNDYVAQNRKNIRNHTDESVIAQRWGNIFNAD